MCPATSSARGWRGSYGGGCPAPITGLIANSDFHIVTYYQAVYRGLVNYYRMAHNLCRRLTKVRYVLEVSMVKTLANKHKCSCAMLWRKHKTRLPTENGPITAFVVRESRDGKPDLVATFGGLSLKRSPFTPLPDRVLGIFSESSDLIQRLRATRCQLCGAEGVPLENHHVRRLADLARRREPLPKWKEIMIKMRRKTLTVCESCHQAIHAGRYDGPAVS